jgi:hypothetical protein
MPLNPTALPEDLLESLVYEMHMLIGLLSVAEGGRYQIDIYGDVNVAHWAMRQSMTSARVVHGRNLAEFFTKKQNKDGMYFIVTDLIPSYVIQDKPGLEKFYRRACQHKTHMTPHRTKAIRKADKAFPLDVYTPILNECTYFAGEILKTLLVNGGRGVSWRPRFREIAPAVASLVSTFPQRRPPKRRRKRKS